MTLMARTKMMPYKVFLVSVILMGLGVGIDGVALHDNINYEMDLSTQTSYSSNMLHAERTAISEILIRNVRSSNEDAFCQIQAEVGLFKPVDDYTCTKFIYCYFSDDQWSGVSMQCPTGQYFQPDNQYCFTTKPDGCA